MTVCIEAFLDNDTATFSYVVFDAAARRGVVIDPVLNFDVSSGQTHTDSVEKINTFIQQEQLNIDWILETHAHADHLTGAQWLRDKLTAKVAIGEHIQDVQKVFSKLFNLSDDPMVSATAFDKLLSDGETLTVAGLTIRAMHTPGHTPADMVYIINDQHVFVGDTIFMPDVGTARCDFPGGDATRLYHSVSKILAMDPDTQLYMCHDYPPQGRGPEYQTTVAAQLEHNKHVKRSVSLAEFVQMREERDATLAVPKLIMPAIQVNIRAGHLPTAEGNGVRYLKLPLDQTI
ncbi:MAG: MBL fold metallo-hydrolase [Gammaproteobacteria bacterium]|nr:MBL fold metallo-hydrolase [Gammaproteobacteria bacterium]NVK87828.1 MBL fold metallo-hydrolase [Gammaproteobacteria bacterium]